MKYTTILQFIEHSYNMLKDTYTQIQKQRLHFADVHHVEEYLIYKHQIYQFYQSIQNFDLDIANAQEDKRFINKDSLFEYIMSSGLTLALNDYENNQHQVEDSIKKRYLDILGFIKELIYTY